MNEKERFEAKLVSQPNGCIEFTGAKHSFGYGMFRYKGNAEVAHRVSWLLYCGEIPQGLKVLHKCDNPPCCNPEHLFLGTDADNIKDKIKKGRQPDQRGTQGPKAILNDDKVRIIHNRIARGDRLVDIALDYMVAPTTISGIKSGATWPHIYAEFHHV